MTPRRGTSPATHLTPLYGRSHADPRLVVPKSGNTRRRAGGFPRLARCAYDSGSTCLRATRYQRIAGFAGGVLKHQHEHHPGSPKWSYLTIGHGVRERPCRHNDRTGGRESEERSTSASTVPATPVSASSSRAMRSASVARRGADRSSSSSTPARSSTRNVSSAGVLDVRAAADLDRRPPVPIAQPCLYFRAARAALRWRRRAVTAFSFARRRFPREPSTLPTGARAARSSASGSARSAICPTIAPSGPVNVRLAKPLLRRSRFASTNPLEELVGDVAEKAGALTAQRPPIGEEVA